MANLGLPYKGSKSKIAKKIIDFLPSADVFVDLFCGGCAMTHAAMLSGKYRWFVANDIKGDTPELFLRAVRGEFRDEKRWVSHDDFFKFKDKDAFVRICWSFGNDSHSYIYSKAIEPHKRALHYAVLENDWDEVYEFCPDVANACRLALKGIEDTKERRIVIGRTIAETLNKIGDRDLVASHPLYRQCRIARSKSRFGVDYLKKLQNLENLERLQRLESLERLQRLQSLERLERLQGLESLESLERLERIQNIRCPEHAQNSSRISVSGLSYDKVGIPKNSVVYADPPYENTTSYGFRFDHQRFYNWLREQEFPIFISGYQMPDDFVSVLEMAHASTICAYKQDKVTERVFVHERWIKELEIKQQIA